MRNVIEDRRRCDAGHRAVQSYLARTPEDRQAGVGKLADHPEWNQAEAVMMTTTEHALIPNQDCVVQRLRICGASSLEDLTRLPGLDWVTVFSLIDRLSRTGSVVLRRNGAAYRVSSEQGT